MGIFSITEPALRPYKHGQMPCPTKDLAHSASRGPTIPMTTKTSWTHCPHGISYMAMRSPLQPERSTSKVSFTSRMHDPGRQFGLACEACMLKSLKDLTLQTGPIVSRTETTSNLANPLQLLPRSDRQSRLDGLLYGSSQSPVYFKLMSRRHREH